MSYTLYLVLCQSLAPRLLLAKFQPELPLESLDVDFQCLSRGIKRAGVAKERIKQDTSCIRSWSMKCVPYKTMSGLGKRSSTLLFREERAACIVCSIRESYGGADLSVSRGRAKKSSLQGRRLLNKHQKVIWGAKRVCYILKVLFS